MKEFGKLALFVIAAALIPVLFFGCATGDGAKAPDEEAQAPMEPPLDQRYANVVFYDVETTPQIKSDYPGAMEQLQVSAISTLMTQNVYDRVERKGGAEYQGPTLYVKVTVPDLRIVGSAARMWGGAFAGSSSMSLDVQLIDGATGDVVREKRLESANNAFAASWTGGASDQTLPSDMGKILAEYILATVPPA